MLTTGTTCPSMSSRTSSTKRTVLRTARLYSASARCTTAWARVLVEEFAHLVEDVDKHRRTDIDAYGATSPAEFFAVVTEVFFEKPEPLKRRHPELYEQLALFYRQDPAARANTSTAAGNA
jgi:Mlc titration factor MtfA (ptsG expression regulator)